MPIAGIIAAAAEGAEIGEVIAHLVKDAKRKGRRLRTPEIISILPAHTAASCANVAKQLRKFQADLIKHKIDTTKTLQQIEREPGIYKRIPYNAISAFRKRIEFIKNEIIDLHDDAVAVAQCLDDILAIPRSYAAAAAATAPIRELKSTERPIGEVIDYLAKDMEKLAERLRDAARVRT
jgi:hypothetical protein